jgi:hypothetical protein
MVPPAGEALGESAAAIVAGLKVESTRIRTGSRFLLRALFFLVLFFL